MAAKAVRAVVVGRVQGVGFRAFVEREAMARGLAGWVRNRGDGSVEAVFSGDAPAVDALLTLCRRGPRAAIVIDVRIQAYAGPALSRFTVLPTA